MDDTIIVKLTDVTIQKLKSIGGISESLDNIINRLIKTNEEVNQYIQTYVKNANGKCIFETIFGTSIIANHHFDIQDKCTKCGIQGPLEIKQDEIEETISTLVTNVLGNALQNIDSECHGCSGKGWIENSKGDLKICPVCEGEGKLNKEKDCTEKDKERDNLPWYPWYPCYPCPDRTSDPYWPTYPIVTYCNVKTDDCTNCNNPK